MRIIISGYGRMGKLIQECAILRGHTVSGIFDNENDWLKPNLNTIADVVIDFSTPQTVVHNIETCFLQNIPIVTGTTAWYDKLGHIKTLCQKLNGSLFFAPNFSIGVNIFFEINSYLAQLMQNQNSYNVSLEETHHTEKIDSPSGTAAKLAQDILSKIKTKKKWVNFAAKNNEDIEILSHRVNNIIGNHKVIYNSEDETIIIEHNAKSRKGFAIGALMAAEWLIGKKGVFEMKDMLNT